jgi:hypothetical protein
MVWLYVKGILIDNLQQVFWRGKNEVRNFSKSYCLTTNSIADIIRTATLRKGFDDLFSHLGDQLIGSAFDFARADVKRAAGEEEQRERSPACAPARSQSPDAARW